MVSGINAGANLGDDVIYSERWRRRWRDGCWDSRPSRCHSHPGAAALRTAARVARVLVERIVEHPLDSNVILNVNVPDVKIGALGGFRATRLGHRHRSEPVVRMNDPRGEPSTGSGRPEPSRTRVREPTSTRCVPVGCR